MILQEFSFAGVPIYADPFPEPCPKCGSTKGYLAWDYYRFCLDCFKQYVAVVPPEEI